MGMWWLVALALALGSYGGVTQAEEILLHEQARKAGSQRAIVDLEKNMSLFALAFADPQKLPTPKGGTPTGGRLLSTSPYIMIFEDFLTEDECDFLQALGKSRLSPALVVQSSDNWYDTQTQTRSNEQFWLTGHEETSVPLLRHMLKRMHRLARVPDENVEALQVGRYNISNKYEGHKDTDPSNGVGRPATLIMYLADVEAGGDTLFPLGRKDCGAIWHVDKEGKKEYGASPCCNSPERDTPQTVRVHPKKGRAVLFLNHRPDGTVDQGAHHIGCPVREGVKWIAQRWFRFEPYNRADYTRGDGHDVRFDGAPARWADEESSSIGGGEQRNFRVLSKLKPRAYVEERFLGEEELEALRALLGARMEGEGSSSKSWVPAEEVREHALLANLTEEAYLMARLPRIDAPIRVSRFLGGEDGERAHMDSPPSPMLALPEDMHQLATLRVHLRAPLKDKGGELAFSHGVVACQGEDLAACCGAGVEGAEHHVRKVRPMVGEALLLFSHVQDGGLDPAAEHVVCPVLEGELLVVEWPLVARMQTTKGIKKTEAESKQPQVIFENTGAEPLTVYWLSPQKEEVKMLDLPGGPNTRETLDSFQSHVFVVRNEAGELTSKVTVGRGAKQTFKVGPERSEM